MFQAVSASRDMCVNSCPTKEEPSQELEKQVGHVSGNLGSVPASGGDDETDGTSGDTLSTCPTSLSAADKGSGPMGQVLEVSPREERSPEELQRLMQEAARLWD